MARVLGVAKSLRDPQLRSRSVRQLPIDLEIVTRHALCRESLLKPTTDLSAIELGDPADGAHGLLDVMDNKPCDTIFDYLGYGSARKGNHGRTAGHGFDHDQSKGLGPVDWKQQRASIAEKLALIGISDLTHELHEWICEQGLDLSLKIRPVGVVHFGGDPQRQTGATRDLDGAVRTLFRRDATQEGQVPLIC